MKANAQSSIEYGLLVASVAVLALLGGYTFGQAISDWLAQMVEIITSHR